MDIWKTVKLEIKEQIPDHSFRMWIDTMNVIKEDNNILILSCPNSFSKEWILKKYSNIILTELHKIAGNDYDFKIEIVESDKKQKVKTKQKPVSKQLTLPNVNNVGGRLLRKGFTFDQFVVGGSNRFAYSAAYSLANKNEIAGNNLFLVSKTGLGKSHLSQAIGHQIVCTNPGAKVYYVTAEDFANEMVSALQNKSIEKFKNKYRKMCDVFILEDVHFLSGKNHTQEELSYTLDILQETEKKIIFTSSYYPKDIPKMQETLNSRLSSGLITEMTSPDYNTRYKIVEKKAHYSGYNLPEEVNHYIAAELTQNVRQLESALIGVMARSSLLGTPVDIYLAEDVINNIKDKQKEITIESIKKIVCSHYKLSNEDMISKSRKKNIVVPRQIAIFLCRRYTEQSLQIIGKHFKRHHATAFHAVNAIEKKVKQNGPIQKQIEYLCNKLDS